MAKWCILLCLFCIFQVSGWQLWWKLLQNWMHLKTFSIHIYYIYIYLFFLSSHPFRMDFVLFHLVLYGAASSQWSARISRNRTEKRTWKTTEKWCIVVWWWQWWWCWTSIIRLTIPFFNRTIWSASASSLIRKIYTFSMLNKFSCNNVFH